MTTMQMQERKVLRLKVRMDNAVSLVDYEFYRDLWTIAKKVLRKMKKLG